MNATTLSNGTKVKTVYGNWITVMSVNENTVYFYEDTNSTYHISKLLVSTAK